MESEQFEAAQVYQLSKGSKGLKYDNYIFTFHKKSSNSKRWRCRKLSCKAALFTRDVKSCDDLVLKFVGQHNHPPPTAVQIELESARKDLKRRAEEDGVGPPSKEICQWTKGKESLFSMKDYRNLSQAMLRQKKKKKTCS